MTKYNGHKNWNHWNVSLWINNDEGLYSMARQCIGDAKAQGKGRDHAAKLMLSALTGHQCVTHTPDGAPYSVSAIRAAMAGM